MKRIKLLIISLIFTLFSSAQLFDENPGRYYEQPGKEVVECIDVEYFDNQYQVFQKGRVCRKTVWIREIHEGFVWIPNYTNGTWRPEVRKRNYYWTFRWSDWSFKKID